MNTTLTSSTLTTNEAAVAGGVFGAVLGTITVVALVFFVLYVIATWRIFEKAGEPGWKALIPFYNAYIMFKIVKMKNWFWWILALAIIYSIISALNTGSIACVTSQAGVHVCNFAINPIVIISSLIYCIVLIWAEILYSWRTSKVFGHGIGYTFGLIFLPTIFWLILGFGKSKYNKKRLN